MAQRRESDRNSFKGLLEMRDRMVDDYLRDDQIILQQQRALVAQLISQISVFSTEKRFEEGRNKLISQKLEADRKVTELENLVAATTLEKGELRKLMLFYGIPTN